MPPIDLPRGNAAKPAAKPAPAPSPIFQAVHGYALPPAPAVKPAPTKVVLRPPATPRPSPVFQAIHGSSAPYKPDPAAIIHVFRAQPPKIQQAIVKGAAQTADVPASKIILDYVKQQTSGPAGLTSPLSAAIKGADLGAVFNANTGPELTVLKNAAKDLVNLPAETISTLGTVGGHVGKSLFYTATGQFGKAGAEGNKVTADVVDPYVQLAEHPSQSFIAHPLDTALMVSGLAHGASRVAAAPVRALAPESAVGRLVSTERPAVQLTGKLTRERPAYSPSPTIKAGQVALEKATYRRNPLGELEPRSAQTRTRQINQGVGELVGTRERIRRVNRQEALNARTQAIQPSRAARVGKAARRTLAYGSRPATIPGADVLARIADGTIRRPDTIEQDLRTHLAQVSANRPNLLDDPKALKAHDQYVKTLQKALGDKNFLRSPARAFKAAEAYGRDYAPVEAKAQALGHFRDMEAGALQRRSLMHYAVTHMGARMDETNGLVDAAGNHLPNGAILAHLKGPNGTGGRVPAFTTDRVRFDPNDNSAFYVSSEHRPTPVNRKNTLYAYTHGLTSPGHEALTEQHVLMQGIVDAHHSQNTYAETLAHSKADGSYWKTYAEAKRDAPTGYRPVNLSEQFHPQESLEQAMKDVAPASIEEEAVRRSLDLSGRLQPGTGGRWGLIDQQALKALRQHENQITPNPLLRTFRGLNNQFRTVALSTSPKHVLGVAQENLIRDIAHGVGFRSWLTGRRILGQLEHVNPEKGGEVRTSLTGGQVAGMTEAGKTYAVSSHWEGTNVHPFLKAMEATFKAPGPRQLRTAWRAWTKFAIGSTKHLLEQQHQIAGLGKAALREHGYAEAARTAGFMGLARRALGLHGRMLDDAARGMFDPAKQRQMRATINQMYGKWTDLSPSAQTALMFSPFGLWWINSVKFLARMPADVPVKTSLLASATVGTQQEREQHGLDLFGPNPLPAYEQGGIPIGGKILAQNYYSPFGIANDPLATGQSLVQPWMTPSVLGSVGVNWLGRPLSSPSNPHGSKSATEAQKIQYILDSAAASFVPLYTKAQQVASGGESTYDVRDGGVLPSFPPTKQPGSLGAGVKKATLPVREYKAVAPKAAGGGWGASTSQPAPSSSGHGWGASTSSSSKGGWGG